MALVAYGSSGEDSEEEVGGPCEKGVKSIFNILPEPTIENGPETIEEVEDEFLFKKEPLQESKKKRTVITVPSLSQFEKEDNTKIKSKQKVLHANTASCKLFQILPPPKHSASEESVLKLIPKCLNKKQVTGKSQVELAREKARKKRQELLKSTANYKSDSDEDDMTGSDFFSLDKPDEPLIGTQMNHNLVASEDYAESISTHSHINMNPEDYIAEDYIIDPEVVKPIDAPVSHEVHLSKEDIMKIDKTTKRKAEDIEFIDVNESDLLLKPEERIKALSVEKNHVSFTKQCAPLAKKKHQITYLAQLAKEKEVELKDMWAQNRVSRRQTQAKYGF